MCNSVTPFGWRAISANCHAKWHIPPFFFLPCDVTAIINRENKICTHNSRTLVSIHAWQKQGSWSLYVLSLFSTSNKTRAWAVVVYRHANSVTDRWPIRGMLRLLSKVTCDWLRVPRTRHADRKKINKNGWMPSGYQADRGKKKERFLELKHCQLLKQCNKRWTSAQLEEKLMQQRRRHQFGVNGPC